MPNVHFRCATLVGDALLPRIEGQGFMQGEMIDSKSSGNVIIRKGIQ